jgi:hypothetical protein
MVLPEINIGSDGPQAVTKIKRLQQNSSLKGETIEKILMG